MQKTFSEIYDNLLSDKADNIRIKELRELLTEQLSSMEDILVDLSFRTSQVRSIDPKLSAAVRDYFGNLGYPNTKACVYSDENLCMHADIYLTADFVGDTVKTTAAVSSVLDCDMGLPTIAREDRLVRISFTELPAYVAQTAAFTASAGGEYSGDSYEIFDLNGCEKYVALSDGMGTGKRARLDSVFTVRLAEKLICSGLSMKTAHRLINSVLRVKGWEESFATLDLLRIDLNGGTGRFLKSGAPMSVLCRDGCVKYIGGQAFPAGIFAECLPDVCEVKLFDGDIILMFSDGVDEESAERISRMAAMGGDLEKLTLKMGRYVLEKNGEENKDDITIVSIKIKNNLEKC
jgi:stage II sporulation protein E